MRSRLWNRCLFLLRLRRFDRELKEEIDFHREMLEVDSARKGLAAGEAALAAKRQLGNTLVAQEDARVPWKTGPIRAGHGLLIDLRDALRSLRAGRGTIALAFLILTLGIATGTVTFSVVDALALRPLPYREPSELIAVVRMTPRDKGYASLAPQDYFALVRALPAFDGVAAAGQWSLPGETPDNPPVIGARTTTNYFDVLGVAPLLGRGLRPGEDVEGNDAVIVLSHQFWTQRLGGDPGVLGRRLKFGRDSREVVGVMPEEFAYWLRQGKAAEYWVPYVPRPEDKSEASPGRSYFLQAFGRLRPGASAHQVQSQIETVAARMIKPSYERESRFATLPLQDLVVGPAKSWLLLVLAAVGLVLLASCVNVANLLLARATVRRRELATREALGASRGRLARTLLFEGLVLALVSAVAGVAASYWGVATAKSLLPEGLARVRDIAVDGRVLLASVSAATLCGLIFGAAPAFQARRRDLTNAIKNDGGNVIGGRGRISWLGAFLIAEVAFVVTLLVGTGLVVATFVRIMTTDLGFDRRDVVTFSVSKPLAGIPREQRAAAAEAFLNDVIARAAAVPGVVAAGVVRNGVPMAGGWASYGLTLPNGIQTGDDFTFHPVTPGYFQTMGVRLLRGRVFAESDQFGAPPVAVINDVAARQFFPNSDPVGQVVGFEGPTTIVGVVAGVHVQGPEEPMRAELYVPLSQRLRAEGGAFGDLVVRVSHATPELTNRVAAAITPALNGRKSPEPEPVDALFQKVTAQRRFSAAVLAVFGLVATVVAAIGIYGVITFLVAQQTREIGLRIALGASSRSVVTAALGPVACYVALGVIIGLGGARALSRLFSALVFGITATDPRVYIAAAGLLLAVAVVAALVPARRATRVDPLAALRSE